MLVAHPGRQACRTCDPTQSTAGLHSLKFTICRVLPCMQPVIKSEQLVLCRLIRVNGQCNFRYYSFLFWTFYSYSVLLPIRRCHYYSYSISVLQKIVLPIPVFVNEFILNFRFYSIIVNENIHCSVFIAESRLGRALTGN